MITQFARFSVIGGVLALTPMGASAALVAHWDFEEGSPATTTVEQVSSTASAEFPTGISWAGSSGAPGQSNSLAFAGTTDNKKTLELDTNLTGADIFITGTGARTIAAWININTTAAGRQGIFNYSPGNGNGAGGDLRFVYDITTANNLRLEVNSGAASHEVSLNDGQWHFVVAVIPANATAGDVNFYIDGSFYDGGSNTRAINTTATVWAGSSGNVFIGNDHINSANGAAFQGMIDNVQVYSTALTSQELSSLYTTGAIPEPASFGLLGVSAMLLLRARRRA